MTLRSSSPEASGAGGIAHSSGRSHDELVRSEDEFGGRAALGARVRDAQRALASIAFGGECGFGFSAETTRHSSVEATSVTGSIGLQNSGE
jgi:hypothetical protein